MLGYRSEALLTMARPKGRRGSRLGASLLGMSLSRNPKRIPFTPAVAIDVKGRRDRENEFRMAIGRTGCREGDIASPDARGDGHGMVNLALYRDCSVRWSPSIVVTSTLLKGHVNDTPLRLQVCSHQGISF